ncbi:MAG: purine-binding chemotaxis protein CheW [Phycisphaeraceae bacterium]|nr:purine-binding chemotaxis protein CheW [Phycisphaeraceae bacterium]
MSDAQQTVEATRASLAELAGKYLTFRLSKEEYGLEILKVREIIGLMDITQVPRTPPYVRGVINLRGKIIPVVELRVKFGMDSTKDTELTCIIVVDVPRDGMVVQMGILVDTVSEVLDIVADEIEPAPSLGAEVDTSFILGIAKRKGEVRILLNIEQVLSTTELVKVAQIAESVPAPAEAA